MKKNATIHFEDIGKRLDSVLAAKFANFSRSAIKKLIEAGAVSIQGKKITDPKKKITDTTNTIEIDFPNPTNQNYILAENIPLNIIYEDDYMLVLDKPAHIAVHPGAGLENGTIVNALVGRDANFAKAFERSARPGIVHRIDKDTSGCLIIAKTQKIQDRLIELFASRQVEKRYLAITYGCPKEKEGIIDTFFGRHPVLRKKMAVVQFSTRRAITEYKVLEEFIIKTQHCARIEINLKTGRTHQIRVHLAHIKCPVLGDKIYGGRQKLFAPRQLLHAWKISLPHPQTGSIISFESPIPNDIKILTCNRVNTMS